MNDYKVAPPIFINLNRDPKEESKNIIFFKLPIYYLYCFLIFMSSLSITMAMRLYKILKIGAEHE